MVSDDSNDEDFEPDPNISFSSSDEELDEETCSKIIENIIQQPGLSALTENGLEDLGLHSNGESKDPSHLSHHTGDESDGLSGHSDDESQNLDDKSDGLSGHSDDESQNLEEPSNMQDEADKFKEPALPASKCVLLITKRYKLKLTYFVPNQMNTVFVSSVHRRSLLKSVIVNSEAMCLIHITHANHSYYYNNKCIAFMYTTGLGTY